MSNIKGQINMKRIHLSLTENQYELLNMLRGEMGNTDSEVVRNILIAWLTEKSFISSKIKKRLKFD